MHCYVADGSIPAATIQIYLADAYDHGAWDQPGLLSSLAAGNLATSVGYYDTGSQILVKYTWRGDANCDDVVNTSGLTTISSTGTRQTGDFNYDGVVNQDDYSLRRCF